MKIKGIITCLACFSLLLAPAQQKLEKTSKSINVNKDVTIDLNTSHTNIIIDTWDKNKVDVEAYIESDELSRSELKEVLKNWDVDIEGGDNLVTIRTSGGYNFDFNFTFASEEANEALKELQLKLADMPMPVLPEMPEMPPMPEMNFDFNFPDMPELPELPELPEGVINVNFDTKAYEKEGEAYLEKWSKEYEEKYGKEMKDKMKAWAKEFSRIDFEGYSKDMEKWGEKFGNQFDEKFQKDMERWGKEYSKRFDEDWAKDMEEWGEKFGEQFGDEWAKEIEEWGEKFGEQFGEEYSKRMEQRAEELQERLQEREARMEERAKNREEQMAKRLEEREKRMEDRAKALQERLEEQEVRLNRDQKVKKTLKIRMPKDAKLKMDVRHGELKFSSVIHNIKANLSHSKLLAKGIDGRNTSINASYTDVEVNDWREGDLNLNYVTNAYLNAAADISLTSNSSNVNINSISNNAIIDGSFGDLYINNISSTFANVNVILENSDAIIVLPKTDYDLIFKGNRSKLNNKLTDKKVINNYPSGATSSKKTILVNAKFSNVVMQ